MMLQSLRSKNIKTFLTDICSVFMGEYPSLTHIFAQEVGELLQSFSDKTITVQDDAKQDWKCVSMTDILP